MADPKPQSQDNLEGNAPAEPPRDYFSLLVKIIREASQDPAQLRKLVYALAWHNLKPEAVLTRPISTATENATTIAELEQALALERAIERIETVAAEGPQKLFGPPENIAAPAPAVPPQTKVAAPEVAKSPPSARDSVTQAVPEEIEPKTPAAEPTAAVEKPSIVPIEEPIAPPENQTADAESVEPHPIENAVLILPERPPAWLEQTDRTLPDRLPPWLDHGVRVSPDSVEYAPIHQSQWAKPVVWNFIQLVGAAVIGVALYVGISGWVYLGRQAVSPPPSSPPPQVAPSAPIVANQAPIAPAEPKPEPQPILPFPLPRTYGVWAGSNGQITELDQLPIKVPDPRILISAEITKPSTTTVAGDKLAFVVFRRELVNSDPQTVSVRVVASVKRAMSFKDGKPVYKPVEGSWRIRAKSYDFKVSPLEANREMVVIQPDPGFIFPAGRYALVLNGFGYDFTIAGPITAPEQCLEQVELSNSVVLSECPKS